MQFKNVHNSTHTIVFLSINEIVKYGDGLKSTNLIENHELGFKLEDGDYNIKINDKPIALHLEVTSEAGQHTVNFTANGVPLSITKIKEPTKYDIFRSVISNFKQITSG